MRNMAENTIFVAYNLTSEDEALDDDDEYYWGYTPTAVDPGPIAFIATLIICFVLLALIPISLYIADRCSNPRVNLTSDDDDEKKTTESKKKKNGDNKSASVKSSNQNTPSTIDIPRISQSTTSSSSSDDAAPTTALPATVSCRTGGERDDISEYGASRMGGASVDHRGDVSGIGGASVGLHSKSSNLSHLSSYTGIVTQISGVMTTVIPNSPTKVPHSRSNASRRRRRHHYVEKLIRDEEESYQRSVLNSVSMDKAGIPADASIDIPAGRSVAVSELDDNSANKAASPLSRPSHTLADDITNHQESSKASTRTSKKSRKSHYIIVDGNEIDPKYDYDPRLTGTKFDKLLKVMAFDMEMKRIMKLMLPFAIQASSTGLLDIVYMAVIGKMLGTKELATSVVVEMLIELSSEFCGGFFEALTTLCSQAIGSSNKRLAGQYVQLSMIFYTISFVPFMIFWAIYMRDIFHWLGFDEETGEIAVSFTYVLIVDYLINGYGESIHGLLDVTDRETYSTIIGITEELVALVTVILTARLTSGNVSLVTLAIIEFGIGVFFLLFNIGYIAYKGWFRPYKRGMLGSCALFNKKADILMLKTSLALSFGYLLTEAEWELLAIFASYIGPAEVSAWGILGTIWGAIEELTQSVADAGEIRCAFLLGNGQPTRAKVSGYKTMAVSMVVSLIISGILWTIGEDLPIWITDDPTLQHIIADLIPIFGFGNLALTMGAVSWTLLGAQGRYRLSTFVAFLTSMFVTLPLSATLSIAFNINLQGQTAAIVIGYMVTGTVNSFYFFRSDWEQLSRTVADHNRAIDSSSSSSSSDDDSSRSKSRSIHKSFSGESSSSHPSLGSSISSSMSMQGRGYHHSPSNSSRVSKGSRSLKNTFSGGSGVIDSRPTNDDSIFGPQHAPTANELEIIYENDAGTDLEEMDSSFRVVCNHNQRQLWGDDNSSSRNSSNRNNEHNNDALLGSVADSHLQQTESNHVMHPPAMQRQQQDDHQRRSFHDDKRKSRDSRSASSSDQSNESLEVVMHSVT